MANTSKASKSKASKATAPSTTALPAAALPAAVPPAAVPPATAPHEAGRTTAKGRRVRVETPEYVSAGDTETASSSHHERAHSTKNELAYLRKRVKKYRVQKARARKARSHRRRYESSGSSSFSSLDSEGYGPRVSFKDNEGRKTNFGAYEHEYSISLPYDTGDLLQLLLHIVRDVSQCN